MTKKIYFSLKPIKGSYGGGNFFVKNMVKYLKSKNYIIVYELESDIDIIFIIDPRRNTYENVVEYKEKNPNVKIIHRVNENDMKREKSINIEPLLIETMKIANIVVFVSKWLHDYFIEKYKLSDLNTKYIINGCDEKTFYPYKNDDLSKKKLNFKINDKIRIVTHHFSSNYLKGFHIYNEIDKLLNSKQNFEFTFIGNYNENYKPKNINLIGSCNGDRLAKKLRNFDIYLTATQYEPGAMHYLEGLSCGLPVLYCINSGGTKEVCNKYGEEYSDIKSFLEKLELIRNNYEKYYKKIDYDYLGKKRCCNEYNKIIENL
jgi:glycosyltransferase involved in cell wall biosynthesis